MDDKQSNLKEEKTARDHPCQRLEVLPIFQVQYSLTARRAVGKHIQCEEMPMVNGA